MLSQLWLYFTIKKIPRIYFFIVFTYLKKVDTSFVACIIVCARKSTQESQYMYYVIQWYYYTLIILFYLCVGNPESTLEPLYRIIMYRCVYLTTSTKERQVCTSTLPIFFCMCVIVCQEPWDHVGTIRPFWDPWDLTGAPFRHRESRYRHGKGDELRLG